MCNFREVSLCTLQCPCCRRTDAVGPPCPANPGFAVRVTPCVNAPPPPPLIPGGPRGPQAFDGPNLQQAELARGLTVQQDQEPGQESPGDLLTEHLFASPAEQAQMDRDDVGPQGRNDSVATNARHQRCVEDEDELMAELDGRCGP